MNPVEISRPNPDELLNQLQKEVLDRQRGKLRLFLGYAAGVGKTYAMLRAAQQRKAEGVDVVVGLIETHGRTETEAMLAGLEVIPRRSVDYHGAHLAELDVDAVLARRPQVVLVDELAHSNAPGSLHPKRYLDVDDLLDVGMDVFTTLNVQHIESLNDIVTQITGVTIHEIIPDRVVDSASEIVLVDIPPEELLKRLEEGKVYIPDQAARALKMFFRKGNLSALREMSMRRAAETVEDQMRDYMRAKSIAGPWAAGERLMVCIGPGPAAERMVRAARRLAGELNCEWLALYVETPAHAHLSTENRERIARALQHAEELGAKTVTKVGARLDQTVLAYARKHNITRIIVGKTSSPAWKIWNQRSVVDQLLAQSGSIDVFVVSGEEEESPPALIHGWIPHRPWNRYALAVLLVAAAAGGGLLVQNVIAPTNLVMLFLLSVVIAGLYLGRGPAVLSASLSVLVFDYFFVPPSGTLAVSDSEYLITFAGLFAVGLVISQLAARLREQTDATEQRHEETSSLYGLSRDLAAAEGMDNILQAITNNIALTFDRDVVIFLPDLKGKLTPIACTPNFPTGEKDQAIAEWAFEHAHVAGRGTDTLPAEQARYLPLKTARTIIGILAVQPHDPSKHLPPEGYRLLEAFASQAALAIERVQLAEQAQQSQILKATERLQSALLNSVSHDLRTPLVSITGALTSLDEQADALREEDRRSLILTAREEADRLNRLVGNLLSITRIESGAIYLHRQSEDIRDIINTARDQLGNRMEGREINVRLPSEMPLIPVDFGLMVQVLVNILENAVKFSPPNSSIDIVVDYDDFTAHLEVADRGVGIPAEEVEQVFEKFFRVPSAESTSGSGLGLSICKGIVEAHGGKIFAAQRMGGGTVVTVEMPLVE
jgi:two-component system, OmpR family, sensor histidine kinase KdpD